MCDEPRRPVLVSVFVVPASGHQRLGDLVAFIVVEPGEIRLVSPQVSHTGVHHVSLLQV